MFIGMLQVLRISLFCFFEIACRLMKNIVFVPLGTLDLTSCASHPKSFSSDRSNIFALGNLMRCWYSSKSPDTLLMIALVTS